MQRKPLRGGITSLGGGQGEVELDIEVIAGLAPNLSHLLVYEDPVFNMAATFQSMANDNLARVVSTSWGVCEASENATQRAAETTVLMQMASQGMSVFNAIGDYGSSTCYPETSSVAIIPDELGSLTYITDVGGTTLHLNANNTIQSEVVWNDNTAASHDTGAGSGGISAFIPRPAWQTGPGTTNTYSTGYRESPDITADGSDHTGYVVYTSGAGFGGAPSWTAFGGTSAGAPLYAAAFALVNQKFAALGRTPIGFANPALYALWRDRGDTFVHDITVGDNCIDPICGTPNSGAGMYPATAGYDMASGIGSLDILAFSNAYIADLNIAPSVTVTSSMMGTSTVGQSVTFTATVTVVVGGVTPTGTVSFTEKGMTLGTVTLVPGSGASAGTSTASLTTSALPAGSIVIAATYSGDGNDNAGAVGTVTQLVLATNVAVQPVTHPTTTTTGTPQVQPSRAPNGGTNGGPTPAPQPTRH